MKKRYLFGALGTTLIGGLVYGFTKYVYKGSKALYPYVDKFGKLDTTVDVVLEEDGVYSLRKKDSSPFKILQLTDMHIGGGYLSRHEDKQALAIMQRAIETTKPDCILLTGDLVCSRAHISLSRNNLNSIKIITNMLENIKIPYGVAFGNHDSEPKATHTRRELSEYLMGLEHCLMVETQDTEKINGFSNYPIKLRNSDGSINSVLYMLDSNEYMHIKNQRVYDYIHDDQVNWYENQINKIINDEGLNPPSFVFMHIPISEYDDAWNGVINADKSSVYFYGSKDEKVSSSVHESKLFDKILELKSTVGIFCGHDHLNDFSVEYKGVRFTYGQGIDCILYAKNFAQHKGATLLEINNDGSFNVSAKKHRRINK